MTSQTSVISSQNWLLLLLLSVLWGGSYLFIGIAVKELPPLLIVFARVSIAAAVLLPLHFLLIGRLPRDPNTWLAVGGMGILNNVVPFTLIVYGQNYISAGLASVINATTPLFGALIMAAAAVEALTARKVTGLIFGLLGVVILRGVGLADFNQEAIAILAVLLASASYGVSSLWAKKMLVGIPPVTSATCQLICSSVTMGVLVYIFANPGQYLAVSAKTWVALAALAIVSTATAYLIFFRIIASAGASVVLLVTMLIPISAIFLGTLFLDEVLSFHEIAGAITIGFGLLIIDGRVVNWLRGSRFD